MEQHGTLTAFSWDEPAKVFVASLDPPTTSPRHCEFIDARFRWAFPRGVVWIEVGGRDGEIVAHSDRVDATQLTEFAGVHESENITARFPFRDRVVIEPGMTLHLRWSPTYKPRVLPPDEVKAEPPRMQPAALAPDSREPEGQENQEPEGQERENDPRDQAVVFHHSPR